MSQTAKENAGLEPMAEIVLRFYLMHADVVGWYLLIACITLLPSPFQPQQILHIYTVR